MAHAQEHSGRRHWVFSTRDELAACPRDVTHVVAYGIRDTDLLELWKHSSIRDLDLSPSPDLTDAGFAGISRLHGLERLCVAGCSLLTDTVCDFLSHCSSLHEIDLSMCAITDSALGYLSGIGNLEKLNLNWCYAISDQGLCVLPQLKSLKWLSLWSCEHVSDAGLQCLAEILTLDTLQLPEFAAITDKGVCDLLKRAESLKEIRIANLDEITDRTIFAIAESRGLQRISIEYCRQITSDGLSRLVAPQLRLLRIKNCEGVTGDAVDSFRHKNPGCCVEHIAGPDRDAAKLLQRV